VLWPCYTQAEDSKCPRMTCFSKKHAAVAFFTNELDNAGRNANFEQLRRGRLYKGHFGVRLDHAMLVVGYVEATAPHNPFGEVYFIILNLWWNWGDCGTSPRVLLGLVGC
jgi:hypothetical protein